MINLEQAKTLVDLARDSIKAGLSKRKPSVSSGIKKEFLDKAGVFVTIKINGQLRGCIGFTDPIYSLWEAIVEASQSAAFQDPRFPKLTNEEFGDITIELSVLTPAKVIEVRNPEDYYNNIQVGKDGLLVRGVYNNGLLLPQVATEYNWDPKTFLEQTCVKAGLEPNSYLDYDACRVYKFQSLVFSETIPNGEIQQIM